VNIFFHQTNRSYSIPEALQICSEYIYIKTGKIVQIKLNLNNPEEVKLFEKACQVCLEWFEQETQ
jgi:hypothetical protein